MMERSEAYHLIEQICDDYGLTIAEREALKMAMHDIEFVDLMPTDVAPVVRCRECVYRGDYGCPMYHEEYYWDEDDGGDYIDIDNTHHDGFCDLGERKCDDATD